MKMYQVTHHSTGEIEIIKAESLSVITQAFQLKNESVTIKSINDTQEVITMDTNPVNKPTNPVKEGPKMIKEYLVRTPSLIESASIPASMVYSRIITNDPEYAFGAGTAATLAQIDLIGYKEEVFKLPAMENRTLSNRIKEHLDALKIGKVEDTFGWNFFV